jgi:prepilin-type N-terminal cleavage/methylation domain-containing protein
MLARQKGFTIIELLMVVSVVAILVAIAVPSLRSYDSSTGLRASAQQLAGEVALRTRGLVKDYTLEYDSAELDAAGTHEDAANPIEGVYTRTWTVSDDRPMHGCKRIIAAVSWDSYSGGTAKLATVISSTGR